MGLALPGEIRPVGAGDRRLLAELVTRYWGSTVQISRGRAHQTDRQPGFLSIDASGDVQGFVTYEIRRGACEVTLLQSVREDAGIGTRLMRAVEAGAAAAACDRVWLITTNGNLRALGFYQRIGYEIVAVHRGAVEESRRRKPIPALGHHGIPIRDEIELERRLE